MPSVKPQRTSSQASSSFPDIGFRKAAVAVPREPAKSEAGGVVVGRQWVGLVICVVVDEDAIDGALEVFHRHRAL
ncbi:MAG: hypothetical protein Q8O67_08615 [Deltaproteobacteria bacterium]|nr:hypothetical protein [Deltaproteobacteria bacterium]